MDVDEHYSGEEKKNFKWSNNCHANLFSRAVRQETVASVWKCCMILAHY